MQNSINAIANFDMLHSTGLNMREVANATASAAHVAGRSRRCSRIQGRGEALGWTGLG